MAMMNTSTLCLVSAMDRLWYHQIILGSDPLNSEVLPDFVDTSFPFIKFPSCPSSSHPQSFPPIMDETILPSSLSSPSVSSDDISLVSQEDCSNDEDKDKQAGGERESSQERPKDLKFSVGRKLNKSISCKSLGDLELEEVKGFMDLGFQFKRENLSPQMVKLLPGLQRLRVQMDKQNLVEDDDDENENENDDGDHKKRYIARSRPYLEEAWTIKSKPNFPLLNLKMTKVSSTSDMKKHLKSWAKIVAYEMQ